jgi:hypothetical protein
MFSPASRTRGALLRYARIARLGGEVHMKQPPANPARFGNRGCQFLRTSVLHPMASAQPKATQIPL